MALSNYMCIVTKSKCEMDYNRKQTDNYPGSFFYLLYNFAMIYVLKKGTDFF
jgi:hypothetical protein